MIRDLHSNNTKHKRKACAGKQARQLCIDEPRAAQIQADDRETRITYINWLMSAEKAKVSASVDMGKKEVKSARNQLAENCLCGAQRGDKHPYVRRFRILPEIFVIDPTLRR